MSWFEQSEVKALNPGDPAITDMLNRLQAAAAEMSLQRRRSVNIRAYKDISGPIATLNADDVLTLGINTKVEISVELGQDSLLTAFELRHSDTTTTTLRINARTRVSTTSAIIVTTDQATGTFANVSDWTNDVHTLPTPITEFADNTTRLYIVLEGLGPTVTRIHTLFALREGL
jgi:hypothetical protein